MPKPSAIREGAERLRPARQRVMLHDAISLLEERGRPVTAMRVCANGDVVLLTESLAEPLPSENDDWVALAGETALPRA